LHHPPTRSNSARPARAKWKGRRLAVASNKINILAKSAENSQKSVNQLKVIGARKLTRIKFHAQDEEKV
jgi:hypothetical protein